MADWVADFSWARPDLNGLRAMGCVGVIRYLGPGNGGRDIGPNEAAAIHAAGLGLGLVWETTTTAALAGFKAGWADVRAANHYADLIGWPDDRPIAYAVDTDATPNQIRGPIADTFRGAIAASKRPVRPYGEFDVLEILCGELGLMPCGWQCLAWSHGNLSNFRCLYQCAQVLNGQVDRNDLGPMPLEVLWHPTIPFPMPMSTMEWSDMATREEFQTDLQTARAQIEATLLQAMENIQGNLAGVIRGESGTEQSVTNAALAAILADLQDLGTVPANVDVGALAGQVAQRLHATTDITAAPLPTT